MNMRINRHKKTVLQTPDGFFLYAKAGSDRPAFESFVESLEALEASIDNVPIAMLYWAMGKYRQHKKLWSLLLRSRSYDFLNQMVYVMKMRFRLVSRSLTSSVSMKRKYKKFMINSPKRVWQNLRGPHMRSIHTGVLTLASW